MAPRFQHLLDSPGGALERLKISPGSFRAGQGRGDERDIDAGGNPPSRNDRDCNTRDFGIDLAVLLSIAIVARACDKVGNVATIACASVIRFTRSGKALENCPTLRFGAKGQIRSPGGRPEQREHLRPGDRGRLRRGREIVRRS